MKLSMRLFNIALVFSIILSAVLAGSALAAPPVYVIDHFNSTTEVTPITWAGSTATSRGTVDDSAVLGGEREIEATVTAGVLGQTLTVTTNDAGNSVANAAGGSGVQYTVDFLYDGKGNFGTPGVDATTGLGGVNLTTNAGNPQDEFIIGINSMDQLGAVSVLVYSSATACSVVGPLDVGKVYDYNRKIVEIPFTDFSSMCAGASSNANFSSVRAIILRVTATGVNAGLDINIHSFGTAMGPFTDTGDLPDTSTGASYEYNKVVDGLGAVGAESGPRHIIAGPRLGAGVTAETAQQPSVPASLDTDDGIVTTGHWVEGVDGGYFDVTISNCTGTCYVNAFIDWNQNGKFVTGGGGSNAYDTGEKILSDRAVTNGTTRIRFNVPAGATLQSVDYYVRVRLTSESTGGYGSPWGDAFDGEVEDYYLNFNPNSVSLTRLNARSAETGLPGAGLLTAGGLLVLLAGLAGVQILRKRLSR